VSARSYCACIHQQIHHLEDHKQGAESSSAKNVALDYIGDIGARLRSLQLEMESQPIVPSLDELIAKPSPEGLAKLLDSHMVVQGYLASAARDDSMYAVS
jgi:cohesin loading factor subunit SCC2